jgi:hypothetical protein
MQIALRSKWICSDVNSLFRGYNSFFHTARLTGSKQSIRVSSRSKCKTFFHHHDYCTDCCAQPLLGMVQWATPGHKFFPVTEVHTQSVESEWRSSYRVERDGVTRTSYQLTPSKAARYIKSDLGSRLLCGCLLILSKHEHSPYSDGQINDGWLEDLFSYLAFSYLAFSYLENHCLQLYESV